MVVGAPVDAKRLERARRQCLERLVWELGQLRVATVIVESRQEVRDRADTHALAAFRRQGSMPATMTLQHARPVQEPLLWLADVVAGSVLSARRGEDKYRAVLGEALTEVEIRLS